MKVGHPGERDVNPDAGKLVINMDKEAYGERTLIVLRQLSHVSCESFQKLQICDHDQKP